ncbi:uncharacterized protein LOC125805028 isoform X3 [Astyanax mexicanus]|uniref:uncharacterized protein LOC125805028 isoform X3 n=1 Tax=Astyanax mexicanus TaxID=7994 RepID=UPI0020CAD3CA|nr:uncharacterized protein LOC125805028 isoform X3 [Astyanax mexicanus]
MESELCNNSTFSNYQCNETPGVNYIQKPPTPYELTAETRSSSPIYITDTPPNSSTIPGCDSPAYTNNGNQSPYNVILNSPSYSPTIPNRESDQQSPAKGYQYSHNDTLSDSDVNANDDLRDDLRDLRHLHKSVSLTFKKLMRVKTHGSRVQSKHVHALCKKRVSLYMNQCTTLLNKHHV